MSSFVFSLLGAVKYRAGGELRDDWEPRIQAAVSPLLIHAGRPISRNQVSAWMWGPGERGPQNLASTMNTYVSRLRRILDRADGGAKLIARAGTLRIDIPESWVDYHVFHTLVDQARNALQRGDPQGAYTKAHEANALWQPEGPLFGIESEPARNWCLHVVREELLPARETMITALLWLRRFADALARLHEFQEHEPGHVGFIKQRMIALHGLGRLEEATRYFIDRRKEKVEAGEDIVAREMSELQGELVSADTQQVAVSRGARRKRNLPPDVPGFVGRTASLDDMNAAVTAPSGDRLPGLIILEGQGGVGKTTLALHWAHQLALVENEFVFYHDLQGFGVGQRHEADYVVDELLAALGGTDERRIEPAQRARKLRDLLAECPALVILDNVRNSQHVNALLPLLADCAVVIASRQKLTGLTAWSSMARFTLRPLETSDGVSLLTERIGDRAEQAPHNVARIAQLSGGLPLALQVIAQYIDRHPDARLVDFIDVLRDRATLLDIGADGDHPSISLRASFALSYETLTTAERRLFATLALFPGDEIGLAAASALVGEPVSTIRKGLDALIGAHLIESPTPGRFRFHDLLRDYGRECVAEFGADHQVAAKRRLLSWYLRSGQGADQVIAPHRNVPTLLPLESGVHPMEFESTQDAQEWLSRERSGILALVASSVREFPEYAWRLPHCLYRMLRREGRYLDARAALDNAVTATRILGDAENEAGTRHDLGQILLALGQRELAVVEFHHANKIAELHRSAMGMAVSLQALAGLDIDAGHVDEGMALYQQALDHARAMKSLEPQVAVLLNMGRAHRRRGARMKALPLVQRALLLSDEARDSHVRVKVLAELARISVDFGDFASAEAHGTEALELVTATDNREDAPGIHIGLALVHSALGRRVDAIDHARQAVVGARQLVNHEVEAEALYILGTELMADAKPVAAFEALTRAGELSSPIRDAQQLRRIESLLDELAHSSINVPNARTSPPPAERQSSLNNGDAREGRRSRSDQ